jgi:hypothetical protein
MIINLNWNYQDELMVPFQYKIQKYLLFRNNVQPNINELLYFPNSYLKNIPKDSLEKWVIPDLGQKLTK